jgi:hypothetical protein
VETKLWKQGKFEMTGMQTTETVAATVDKWKMGKNLANVCIGILVHTLAHRLAVCETQFEVTLNKVGTEGCDDGNTNNGDG